MPGPLVPVTLQLPEDDDCAAAQFSSKRMEIKVLIVSPRAPPIRLIHL